MVHGCFSGQTVSETHSRKMIESSFHLHKGHHHCPVNLDEFSGDLLFPLEKKEEENVYYFMNTFFLNETKCKFYRSYVRGNCLQCSMNQRGTKDTYHPLRGTVSGVPPFWPAPEHQHRDIKRSDRWFVQVKKNNTLTLSVIHIVYCVPIHFPRKMDSD